MEWSNTGYSEHTFIQETLRHATVVFKMVTQL